jgi:SAM-dependent methyltransferase
MGTMSAPGSSIAHHFAARADGYNSSGRWVTDERMAEHVLPLLELRPAYSVLDVACGTGMWARVFQPRVAQVVGVDIVPAMYRQGRPYVAHMVHAPAERLPFRDDLFDISTVRQGLQFMDDVAAVREMVRVTKPNGLVCLLQLCAYGEDDRDEFFELLRLRNPARRNFYVRKDLVALLLGAGCGEIRLSSYVSEECIDSWADNGAITSQAQEQIQALLREASGPFIQRHRLEYRDGAYYDKMVFGIAIGRKHLATGRRGPTTGGAGGG